MWISKMCKEMCKANAASQVPFGNPSQLENLSECPQQMEV